MGVKIKSRTEILSEIIREAKHHPDGWNATIGRDPNCLSSDYYISHPSIGIFLLKEFERNPFDRIGLGAKIARKIDEDIEEKIQSNGNDFGILEGNYRKIVRNIQRGVSPQTIFDEAIKGNDLGIRIPVKGLASRSHETFTCVHDALQLQQKNIDARFEKMMAENDAYTSYS